MRIPLNDIVMLTGVQQLNGGKSTLTILIMVVLLLAIVYIAKFPSEFDKEDKQKAGAALGIISAFVIVLSLL